MDVHVHTLSRKRQCELLGVARSSSYYKPVTPTAAEQEAEANLARALQALYLQDATLGRRRLPCMLERQHGIRAGYKRIATIRKKLGLRTIFRHPQTTVTANPRKGGKYPYRLRDKKIERIDEVWTSDITYLQIGQKNYYLCAVIDWASRGILGWSLKDNMSTDLCRMRRRWRSRPGADLRHSIRIKEVSIPRRGGRRGCSKIFRVYRWPRRARRAGSTTTTGSEHILAV